MEPIETTMKSLEELEKCFETDQAKSLMVFVDDMINTTVDHFAERIDQRFAHMEQRFDSQDKNISMLKWVVGVGTAILLSLMAILLSLGIAGLA